MHRGHPEKAVIWSKQAIDALIALDGDLARAEPKTLRYRLLHAAARLDRGGRRRTLRIGAAWPWSEEIVTAW